VAVLGGLGERLWLLSCQRLHSKKSHQSSPYWIRGYLFSSVNSIISKPLRSKLYSHTAVPHDPFSGSVYSGTSMSFAFDCATLYQNQLLKLPHLR
jgi:hypothetical protein